MVNIRDLIDDAKGYQTVRDLRWPDALLCPDTIFAVHHQPLRIGMICLYFMGLNRFSWQIAKELDMDRSDVQAMV